MAFNPFQGFVQDAPPSIYDVQRRQALAKQLGSIDYAPNSGALGALAMALGGAGSAYQNSAAADEAQTGLTDANAALAKALTGGASPADMITAGGNPFLPESESGLVSDVLKRKLGLGTVYGNNLPYMGKDGQLHFAAQNSYGDTLDLPAPGGGQWLAPVTYQNQGTQLAPTTKFGGSVGAAPVDAGGPTALPINNAQAEADKSAGGIIGTNAANAPAQLQTEGQLLQTLDNQHQMVDQTVDKAIGQIDSGAFNTGTVGSLLSAVPGSPQYDLAQNLQTIKANVGFDTLQNMRANSPTGGALGQISNMEEQLLQAVNGSLEQGQTKDQLKANLSRIKVLLKQVNDLKHQAYESDKQRLGSAPAAPPVIGAPQAAPAAMSPDDPLGLR